MAPIFGKNREVNSTSREPSISTIAVLGAGTMGHGIAHVCAAAGYATRLYDLNDAAVDAGMSKIRSNLDKGVAKGKVSAQDRDRALSCLVGTSSLEEACNTAELVIEAVPEKLEIKRDLFAKVAEIVGNDAILGTNTSSLSVAKIAEHSPNPARVIGLHFFNPVHIMKLLEIVVAPSTNEATLARAKAFGESIGKDCIVVRDSPGFATSRLGLVIGLEAIRMVEQGVASARDIDKAMTLGYGFPMGPLELTDLVGLDVRLNIAQYLAANLPNAAHFEPPALLRELVAHGKLGKKSGEGFYKW
jgi:3-hydroxybutyryl-CoA dehydrogenase